MGDFVAERITHQSDLPFDALAQDEFEQGGGDHVDLFDFGFAAFHWSIVLACALITGGAVIAAKDMIFKRRV